MPDTSVFHTTALVAKTCLHMLLVLGIALVGIPWLVLSRFGTDPIAGDFGGPHWLLAIGALLGAVGCVKVSWSFIAQGDGTPNYFDPPKRLVVANAYRFVRNPGYLGLFAVLVCEALYFGSTILALYALLLLGCLHTFVVHFEEPGLRERFGDEYDQFCVAVPRWIPRLARWDGP